MVGLQTNGQRASQQQDGCRALQDDEQFAEPHLHMGAKRSTNHINGFRARNEYSGEHTCQYAYH